MRGIKSGSFKSSSPLPSARPESPRPSPSAASSSKPARQNSLKDGFDAPVGTKRTWGLFGKPAQQKPQNVTSEFTSNPLNFAGHNTLNAYNLFPGGHPQGVALPTASKPFVPASQSVASLNVHQNQGNSNMSLTPPGGPGAQVHYLHYQSTGTGRFAGISGVPLHPKPGQPNMVVTGPLNGCAVHALHNKNDNTLSFVHHADYSKNGRNELQGFLAENPHLRPAGSFTPGNYSHSTGNGRIETGATSFLHYNTAPGQAQGRWTMVGQLNDWKNGGTPGGRPELARPQNLPVPSIHTLPLETP